MADRRHRLGDRLEQAEVTRVERADSPSVETRAREGRLQASLGDDRQARGEHGRPGTGALGGLAPDLEKWSEGAVDREEERRHRPPARRPAARIGAPC